MVQVQREIRGGIETHRGEKPHALNRVIHLGRATQIRREIGMLADHDFAKGLITEEAYKGYKKVEEGTEEFSLSDEMLESTRKFAREHEAAATRVYEKIKKAGVSEEEMDYLMENWVRNNFDLAKNPSEVERIIEGKLERLLEYKKKEAVIFNHPLIKGAGHLEVSVSKKIPLPSKEAYSKLKRKEQRTLLDELEKSLPDAEKYLEAQEKDVFKTMNLKYQGKLFTARSKKIIGRNTFHKFLNSFTAIKNEDEKQRWLDEFDDQMERYDLLWSQIRETLKGAALKKMESKLDNMGYTELLTAFGKEKQEEIDRLNQAYSDKLEFYRNNGVVMGGKEEGVIGSHTIDEFNLWIQKQEPQDKYDAISKIPDQMQRYQNLWANIKKLNPEQQDYLRNNIDKWGYTEMKAEYERVKKGEVLPVNTSGNEAETILNQVKDSRARNAIVETKETLKKEGGENKIRGVAGVLKRLFGGQRRDQFDAITFKDQVHERIEENKNKILAEAKQEEERQVEGAETENETQSDSRFIASKFTKDPLYQYEIDEDEEDVEEEIGVLDASAESKVTSQTDVIQIETYDDDTDAMHREAQFTLNTGDGAAGARRLLTEDGKHHYQSEASGGHDDVSLAFFANGETVEMNYKTIELATEYFKKSADEDHADQKMDKAA